MAIVVKANKEGAEVYANSPVVPAKWLMPDGSIVDEFPMASGGSDVKLQNNKEVSITENGEIEITPDEGYDGMKKITATVNVSGSGGSATAYAWADSDGYVRYYNFDVAPSDKAEYNTKKEIIIDHEYYSMEVRQNDLPQEYIYEKHSDNEIYISDDLPKPGETTLTRDSTKDFTLWQVNE